MQKNSRILNVLVACEESQSTCLAFRNLGHNAFSCDLQDCSGGHPEYHILSDCLPLLNGDCSFFTSDKVYHYVEGHWDLIIAHPPCTYLSKAGANLLFDKFHHVYDLDRFNKGLDAASFFRKFLNCDCPYVCVENPCPLKIFNLPPASQVIQPYFFGHPYSKYTCLWLKNLPPLIYTCIVPFYKSFVYTRSGSVKRSKSFSGISAAMAFQWSNFILSDYES